MWVMGAYVKEAVGVAVENVLNGSKARATYYDKPFTQQINDSKFIDASDWTEEEKVKAREKLVGNLKSMEQSHNRYISRMSGDKKGKKENGRS